MTQFSKAPNVYFLVIAYMQTIELISISNGKPAMVAPLIFVIAVSMVKDAYEDYKRAKSDSDENNTPTRIFDKQSRSFNETRWNKLFPGDVIKVHQDEAIPADILILHTSDLKGVCYVETKNLDGETNLKMKSAEKELHTIFQGEEHLAQLAGFVKCEKPNNAIYKYEGTIQIPQK